MLIFCNFVNSKKLFDLLFAFGMNTNCCNIVILGQHKGIPRSITQV